MYGVIGSAVFAAAYSLYGGLIAVAWADVIQVFFLVLGGLFTTYLALNILSEDAAPDRFHMILDKSNPKHTNLPGIWVLIGGLWVANLNYWGFNQYIIQRTLAAKSIREAQKGIAMAASLKLLIPFIVVIPGIVVFVIVNDPEILGRIGADALVNMPEPGASDKAYPRLLQMGLATLITMGIIVVWSLMQGKGQDDAKGIQLRGMSLQQVKPSIFLHLL